MSCSHFHFARWLPLRRNHKPWKYCFSFSLSTLKIKNLIRLMIKYRTYSLARYNLWGMCLKVHQCSVVCDYSNFKSHRNSAYKVMHIHTILQRNTLHALKSHTHFSKQDFTQNQSSVSPWCRWNSLVAINPHHSTEDVNKPAMLLPKLALNFRATIISYSISTNVILK